jgi:uncharacterized protein (TIGR01319 family)
MTQLFINKKLVLIDIGSTIIKYFRLTLDGEFIDAGYFNRDYELLVGEQVSNILKNELRSDDDRDHIRICSSANGGLTVGIIGYTYRFSANWAAKAAFNSGANVRWAIDILHWTSSSATPVDILVIAGGAQGSPISSQLAWLDQLSRVPIKSDAVVFSGNTALHQAVGKLWPKAIFTDNVLGEDLCWQGQSLVTVLREAYLNDLVLHKGISGLQALSEVPILPTPAVVQDSYKAILYGQTHLHLPVPLLLIDIGGATTDVFYGSELIANEQGNEPRPPINRYVFTYLGVSASRDSLIERLSLSEHLGDFLRALDPTEAEYRYLAIREGVADFLTAEFLADACFFLALNQCADGLPGGHRIELERVAAIAITGGASQICDTERLERILRHFGMSHASIYVDKNYRIWIEGMGAISNIKDISI